MYHQEYLIPGRTQFRNLFPVDAIRLFVEMIIDAFYALRSLKNGYILHRDISKNNFMYCPADGLWKLIDFDLAILWNSLEHKRVGYFQSGEVVGTEGYMAPESRELKQYSFASDMYSMGTVLSGYASAIQMGMMFQSEGRAHKLLDRVYPILGPMRSLKPESRIPIDEGIRKCYELLTEMS